MSKTYAQQIQEVELKLLSGEDFSELASIYSDDIVSKDTGGDLEYFASDIFPTEFADAIINLNLNDISSIIELDDTLHILHNLYYTLHITTQEHISEQSRRG